MSYFMTIMHRIWYQLWLSTKIPAQGWG